MENNIEVKESHLLCDNPKCKYKLVDGVDFMDLSKWVDYPCPKCGQNMLTQEDYVDSMEVMERVNFVNNLTPEELVIFNNMFPKSTETKQCRNERR